MVDKTEDVFDLHNGVTLNQSVNVARRIVGVVDISDFNTGIAWATRMT